MIFDDKSDYKKISERIRGRFSRALSYLGNVERQEIYESSSTIGVTEVKLLLKEIEKRKLTSGSIVIYNGKNTGIGCGTFVQFPGDDKIVEITDYSMW